MEDLNLLTPTAFFFVVSKFECIGTRNTEHSSHNYFAYLSRFPRAKVFLVFNVFFFWPLKWNTVQFSNKSRFAVEININSGLRQFDQFAASDEVYSNEFVIIVSLFPLLYKKWFFSHWFIESVSASFFP